MAVMTEAEKVSELHLEVKASLMNEDFEKIKNWQKDAFHKQMMGGFKETKEAEDGFRKAQKPWAKKLKEVHPPQGPAPPAGTPPTRCLLPLDSPPAPPVLLPLPRRRGPAECLVCRFYRTLIHPFSCPGSRVRPTHTA